MFKILLIASLFLMIGCQKDRLTGDVSGVGIVEWETRINSGDSVILHGEHFGPVPISGWSTDSPGVVQLTQISTLEVRVTGKCNGHAIVYLSLENGGQDTSHVFVGEDEFLPVN